MKRAIFSLLGMLLLVAAWFGYQAFHLYTAVSDTTGKVVTRTTVEPRVTIPPLNGNKRINILVLGSDNDKKKEESRPLTQSMIVVTIDPKHDQVAMMSIPRDFWVPIRGHGMGKIDLAHKYGGVALARETVEREFGIQIHYYAWVGLNGFIRVIDTFGGVTLDVSHPILDDSYPNDLNGSNPYSYRRVFIPPGWQHMQGEQALEYVRSRHGDAIGDFGRSARQQQVLLQLQSKTTADNMLVHLPQLADELRQSVRTDLTFTQLYQLQQLSHRIKLQNIHQVVLQPPTYSSYGFSKDGQSIVNPNWKTIRPLVKSLFAKIANNRSRPAPVLAGRGVAPAHPTPAPRLATPAPSASRTATASTVVPTIAPTPVPRPTATATATAHVPVFSGSELPGKYLYVRQGNLFELYRNRNAVQLTFTGDVAMFAPSPDARYVALVRFPPFAYASDLWLYDLRRHTTRPIARGPYSPRDIRNNLWRAWPTWSADGKWIYFSWDEAKLATLPSDARPVDLAIWKIDTNGRNAVQVTRPVQGSGGDVEATLRPGTPLLLYVKWNFLQQTNLPYSQLALVDTVSGNAQYLLPIGRRVLQPAWDPTGARITFVRRTNGVDEIAVAPLAQHAGQWTLGNRTVIARGQVAQPAFTPDGKWVSYLRVEGSGFATYLAPAVGGVSVRLSDIGPDIDSRWHPVWIR